MNFHKTIGYLAALLLMVGLGVPDSFAQDAAGLRVYIAKPANGAWVNLETKVEVHVLRTPFSNDWAPKGSITIILRDTLDVGTDVDPVIVGGNLMATLSDLSEIDRYIAAFDKDPAMATLGNLTEDVAYGRSSRIDTLKFTIVIDEVEAATAYTNKLAVFARATFGNFTDVSLDSKDTTTSIYPNSPGIFPEKVGDGKLLRVDAQKPTATTPKPDVTIGKIAIDDDNKADSGSALTVAVKDKITIKAEVTNFRAKTVQLSIEKVDGDGAADYSSLVTGAEPGLTDGKGEDYIKSVVLFTKTFDARTVLLATDPLSATLTVAPNQFKFVAKKDIQDNADDVLVKKDATIEVDGVHLRAKVVAKDEAGNVSDGAVSLPFRVDSKPPVVTITYPDSAHHRFTEKLSQTADFLLTTIDQPLKPLTIKVDEMLESIEEDDLVGDPDSLFVIIGVDTLKGSVGIDISSPDTEGMFDISAFLQEEPEEGEDAVRPEIPFRWTNMHKTKNKKDPKGDAAKGGSSVTLQVVVKDAAGNIGKATQAAIFDPHPPEVSRLFPSNVALGTPGTIGGAEQTQHPFFRINEKVDSMLVRYQSLDRTITIAGTPTQKTIVGSDIRFKFVGNNAHRQDDEYSLQVYVKDLANNVGLSDGDADTDGAQSEERLTFNSEYNNPDGGAFKIVSKVRNSLKKTIGDGKVALAGQAIQLTVTALDTMLTRVGGKDRPAVIYRKAGVKLVAMDSNGNMLPSVKFWGTGVSNNEDGSATLNSDGWSIGARTVYMLSTAAMDNISVVAKDISESGILSFDGTVSGLSAHAADFSKFVVTAWEEGVPQAATSVWGQFTVNVIPTDEFGNPSLKTFGLIEAKTGTVDSLTLLDNKVKVADDNILTEVDIVFSADRSVGGPQGRQTISVGGKSFTSFMAPGVAGSATIEVRVDDSRLTDPKDRSRLPRGSLTVAIQQPVEISITLWVPGAEGDQAGNEVTIPAGGTVTVTARAEGLNEDDMVTFTVDGEAQDAVAADADGYAGQAIDLSGSGTVSVTAMSGQYSASLDITHTETEQEGRVKYVDADGDHVYLIGKSSGTVGVDDFLALVAAFGSSTGDANYNPQADVNDDGSVGVDDFLAFVGSFGKTAAVSGKPIVLLPGINENAEFSLSLGSDGVVAGELMAVDVSLANVEALIGYGFALNYDADKFEFVSVASADEDLLTSTGGETLFHHVVADGQISVATGMYNGTAVSGGGDIVQFVFRVLYEFEDNARFEIADGLVFDPSQLQNPAVVAGVLELQSTPKEFALHQNFPNPFNPDTTIKYDLSESADVTLQIYNVLGQVVRTLVASEAQNAGRYQIRWNGMDDRGVSVSSGIYFYRISAGEFQNVRKLMLLK